MKVTVCIVAFRNPADISACLEALAASTHQDFDVVICENGGAAACDALRQTIPARLPGGQSVDCIAADNPGYAGGVNRCIAQRPDAEGWWILNPDTQPEPRALAALVRRLSRGDVQAVGGILVMADGRVQAYGGRWHGWTGRAESIGWGQSLDGAIDEQGIERSLSYLHGASFLIDREFLARTGPMREDYFLYCEEIEWFHRAVSRGCRLGFARESRVLHLQGTTTGYFNDKRARSRLSVYLDERNKINFTRDTRAYRIPLVTAASVAVAVRRFLLRGALPQFGYSISGISAGLRNERGKPGWLGD